MRKIIIGLAALVILGAAALFFFNQSTNEGPESDTEQSVSETITSDDGKATIEIPADALDKASELKKIKVTRTYKQKTKTGKKITGDDADAGLIGYKLEPDGLKFKKAITFKVTIDRITEGLPFLFQFSNKNKIIELVRDLEIDMDISKKQTTVSAPITHFSNLVLTDRRVEAIKDQSGEKVKMVTSEYGDGTGRPLDIEITTADALVGEFVKIDIVVSEDNSPFFLSTSTYNVDGAQYADFNEFRIEPESIRFSGIMNPAGSSKVVLPRQELVDQPPRTALVDSFSVQVNDHYKCAKPGAKNRMDYSFSVQGEIESAAWRVSDSGDDADRVSELYDVRWHGIIRGNSFKCVNKQPETAMSFEHTKPGDFSTVFLDIIGEPGATVKATLTGPAVAGTPTRELTLESDGTGRIQWQVNRFGTYTANGDVDGDKFNDNVVVE